MGRISARIAAINESATLAVDAKAKALKAAGENVIGFGAGEPDFPTPARDRRGRGRRRAASRASTTTRRRPACPSCGPRSRTRPSATPASTAPPSRCVVTNGGKHAVYNTFQVLCDPGDEVLLPAPYWTSYPECITLGGGVPVVLPTTEATGFRVTIEQLEAARHAAHEGAAVRVAEQPDRRGVPARRGRGHRPLGARARHLDRHRRDLRAPHLRRPRVLVDARPRARARRPVRDPQRRRQDLRDDRLARRLDDRPARRDRGGHQPAVALHVERVERRAGRRARRGRRATSTRSPRCATRSPGAAR